MTELIRSYHEHLPNLTKDLIRNGSLALILLDVSPFAAIEEQYGMQTYMEVRQRIFALLTEQSGKDYRKEDILALDGPGGLRLLLFMSPTRTGSPNSYGNLESLRTRLLSSLLPKLVRTTLPYLKHPPNPSVGFALAVQNPVLDPHHVVLRAIREALEHAKWRAQSEEMESLQQIKETILNERVMTLFQPIVGIRNGQPMGFEALSRGDAASAFQSAGALFDAAQKHHLLIELDRVCRRKALASSIRVPTNAKVFVNTLPATMRDPEFQGQHLVDSLESAHITPDRIVIEITETLVIDNLSMFQDAMTYFTNLGISLAVDDVGSGYSGLETIAKLKPSYLKVDAALTHDLHISMINREMLRAIASLGHRIGAKVVAEGIEYAEELEALRTMDIDYGQGYFLGRPSPMLHNPK
jgi:EAL domain-containing protein (putative c-di-GMP-specific phosphodiesterase class I)